MLSISADERDNFTNILQKSELDFKILDENIGARIQRDLDNSAALEGVHPRDYPHDIYLNGEQYYEWMNEMIETYASRNPDNQSGHGQNVDWMNFGSTHEGREVIGFWMHGDASYTELRCVFKLLDYFFGQSETIF